MDTGRPRRHELDTLLRCAVEQARTAPAPADALARALEGSRRIGRPVRLWLRGLLRGAASPN